MSRGFRRLPSDVAATHVAPFLSNRDLACVAVATGRDGPFAGAARRRKAAFEADLERAVRAGVRALRRAPDWRAAIRSMRRAGYRVDESAVVDAHEHALADVDPDDDVDDVRDFEDWWFAERCVIRGVRADGDLVVVRGWSAEVRVGATTVDLTNDGKTIRASVPASRRCVLPAVRRALAA